MKKQKKQLIILAALLVFLILAYFGINSYTEALAEKEAEENTIQITDFNSDEVVAFFYDYNGTQYSLTKTDDVWNYEGDTSLDMDETAIDTMLSTAGSLLGEESLSEYDSLETYGFDEPTKTVTFTMSDASTIKIQVGDYNDIVGLYYMMVDGDSHLYLTDSTLLNTFEVSYSDLVYEEEETESIESTEELTETTEE